MRHNARQPLGGTALMLRHSLQSKHEYRRLTCGLLFALLIVCSTLVGCGDRTVPEGAETGQPDPAVVGMVDSTYPTYKVLGSEYSRTTGMNAIEGPGSEFVTHRWSFALHNPDLPGKPLVISYIQTDADDDPIEEWTCLDEFFGGESLTDLQVGLAAAFSEDHPGESCLGAYEIQTSSTEQRIFQVGCNRKGAGGTRVASEYTYVLASGAWSWDRDSDYPDSRWGLLTPDLDQ